MPEPDDQQLLREFAETNSEAAFATLVARHVNLVYSTALRFGGNPHRAEEITQAVFIILARKAGGWRRGAVLSGWLYQTARLTAANVVKSEIRRQRREQEAYMQSTLNEPDSSAAWEQISPLLDDAMGRLGETDRSAVVLRYFENKTAREVAAALQLTEAAAHKRMNRALDKLRKFFTKRGVTLATTAIAGAVAANSVHAAPAGLAKTISVVAVAKGATVSTSTLILIKGALTLMAWTKSKTAIVAGVAAILAIGTTTVAVKTVKYFTSPPVESYFTGLSTPLLDAAPPLLILRPSHYANQGDYVIAGGDFGPDGRLMRRGCSLAEILSTAYGVGPQQMILPAKLPRGPFDLLLTVSHNSRQALQAEIKKQFGLAGQMETRDTDVLVLKAGGTAATRLKISSRSGPNISWESGNIKLLGYKMSDPCGYDVAHTISMLLNQPVIDETGLTGAYDLNLQWNANLGGNALQQEIKTVLHDQFGLELTSDRRPVEMLVVEKAK